MEKRSDEDELTSASKRQKLCKPLEKFKAHSSQMLKTLHDHLDMVVEERSRELELKENQLQSLSLKLDKIQKKIEQETDKLKATEVEAGDKGRELDSLRNQIKSEEKTLTELRTAVKNTQKELDSLRNQIKSEEKTLTELRTAVKNTQKELDSLRNQIKSEEKSLTELWTAVKNTQKELESKKQGLRLKSSVLVKHEEQSVAAETELFTGDACALREFSSASLVREEVTSYLRAISTPAKFVLDLAEGQIRNAYRRQKSGLKDLVVQNLVLFLEELSKIEGSYKPQMQLKAKEVANLWKGNIIIEAPRSSLEALAFLLFIVVYGIKSFINEEETALLASSVFHFEQGPRLFHLLGLKRKIPDFVRELIKDHQYIPAVRVICLCKLKDFSPTTLLMKEITDLRHNAMEKSKAENKDVGKLRAIVELVADYKLDIYLPGDLIAKLMFQKENSTPPVLSCSVKGPEETCTSSSNLESTASRHPVASAKRSSVDLLVPKREFKPCAKP